MYKMYNIYAFLDIFQSHPMGLSLWPADSGHQAVCLTTLINFLPEILPFYLCLLL